MSNRKLLFKGYSFFCAFSFLLGLSPIVHANLIISPEYAPYFYAGAALYIVGMVFLTPLFNTTVEYFIGKKLLQEDIPKRILYKSYLLINFTSYYPAFLALVVISFILQSVVEMGKGSLPAAIILVEIPVIVLETYLFKRRFQKLYSSGQLSSEIETSKIRKVVLLANLASVVGGYALIFLIVQAMNLVT